jgi:hypothetical protein
MPARPTIHGVRFAGEQLALPGKRSDCSPTNATSTTTTTDVPPAKTTNITLTAAAQHFGVSPTVISRLERGLQREDTLATNYRQWFNAA